MKNELVRVVHAIGSLEVGGSQSFVMNLYRKIDRSQIQFDFIVEHQCESDYYSEIRSLGGNVLEMPAFRGNPKKYRNHWHELLLSHPEWKILHSHLRSTASFYLPIAKSLGITTIIHSHSTSETKNVIAPVKRLFEYPLRYQADYFFSCSDAAGRWLFGNKLVNQGRVVIVPNSIDTSTFEYDISIRESIRSELNIDDSAFVMGHVGRMVPVKNHEFILRVFQQVHEKNSNSKLLLIGDGPNRAILEKLATELDISNSVIFVGTRSDVGRCLQAMDVFIMPSLYEGFPVSLLEAQASGLPCVISDVVTTEADVCPEAIRRLSLKEDLDIWSRACLESSTFNRADACKMVVSAGFDVSENAAKLQSFYLSIGRDQ